MCCTGQALNKCYPLWIKDTNLSSYYTTQAKSNPTSAFIINNIWNVYLGNIFWGGLSYLKHSSVTILSLQKCLNLYKVLFLYSIYDMTFPFIKHVYWVCAMCCVRNEIGVRMLASCSSSCVLRKETQEKERQISFFTKVTENMKENRTKMENEAE